jgi:hypothetical protein
MMAGMAGMFHNDHDNNSSNMCCKNDSAMLQSSKTVLQVGILFFQPLSS